ncbi:SAM-dependent methyltransferase [Paenibacillus sp. 598K]|uniref:class I SAM-dependent methyltransferase n=1 Tax=Paenibacillus sp. 598K TaxID=1117987 RepID=UPI000FFA18C5|nr:class I SAM-dependent methyltransferase [Paenibacillus sp. 598K]GBF75355.1 SAM-dependent methyltransferase [Paenibacillus sp. 598K]
MDTLLASRFILRSDERQATLIHPLPSTWWSRPYEYSWAMAFASPEAVVLDAACGISHPFKFALAERSREAHACDLDPRITSKAAIIEDISRDFGVEAAASQVDYWQEGLRLACANLTELPYEDALFDRVFCISVLEHMPFNDQALALREFSRVLKPDALLILTFDYPTVSLEDISMLLRDTGFVFAGEVDYTLPEDALHTDMWGGLHCFRAVLRKASDS